MSDRGVCVITGAGRGIGAATARRLRADGWAICIGYRADVAAATALAAELGGQAVRGDVAAEDDVGVLFDAAAELGPIGGVVANAGIVAPAARVDEMTVDRVRTMLDTNVLGTFLTCREAVRRMSTRHGGAGGAIVTVSSAASRIGSPGEYVDYAASKGAVDTLTLGLAKEVAAEGIRVNAVRPGLIETDIHAPGRLDRLGPTTPIGRSGTAEEVANAIAWLLSDEASYCTGAILDVSGGR